MAPAAATKPPIPYVLLALAVVGLALAGFIGLVVFEDLGLSAGSGIGLLALAAAAGVASFFSPCSFPLLVGMLGKPVAERGEGGRQPTRDSLTFATALSLGVVAFLALLGAAVAFGGSALFKDLTFTSTSGRILRTGIGAFMIFMALIQLNRLHISLRRYEPALKAFLRRQRQEGRVQKERPFLKFTLFGFGYLAAGFGCTGPILSGLAGQAFVVGGVEAALIAFGVAAVMMVILMFVLALVIGSAQTRRVDAMKAGAPTVKRWGGRILLALGAWFIALGVFAPFFVDVFPV